MNHHNQIEKFLVENEKLHELISIYKAKGTRKRLNNKHAIYSQHNTSQVKGSDTEKEESK